MTTSGIAGTYARVLFDLATAADSVDATGESINSVAETVRGHMDLRDALTDTQVPAEKKRDVLREIFGGQVGFLGLFFLFRLTPASLESTEGSECFLT